MTINELMVFMKAVRQRIYELNSLRSQISIKETICGGDKTKVIEPQYDIKVVDKKIVELQNFLYKADSKIKQSNAQTTITMDVNVNSLLEPLQ